MLTCFSKSLQVHLEREQAGGGSCSSPRPWERAQVSLLARVLATITTKGPSVKQILPYFRGPPCPLVLS